MTRASGFGSPPAAASLGRFPSLFFYLHLTAFSPYKKNRNRKFSMNVTRADYFLLKGSTANYEWAI
jgi:hypothetical protein